MDRPAPRWQLPTVFAHRCGGALAPENTLAGLPVVAALGIRAVEFDVMLSADESPWLIHDETLERTTNGVGRVCDTTDERLGELDAGSWMHRAFAGERLPRFETAAKKLIELGFLANVEIKPATGWEAQTGEVVARAILSLWPDDALPLVSSFSEVALAAARKVAPQLPIGILWERPPRDWAVRMKTLSAFSLHCAAHAVDDALLVEARTQSVPILCYTVNDRDAATTLLSRGVSAVFSDRPDLMVGISR